MVSGKVAAIITSTYVSNLMPGKSEKVIAGRTVLEHIVGRLRRVPEVEKICLATSTKDYDDRLCSHAARFGIDIYRPVLFKFSRSAADNVCKAVLRSLFEK